MKSMAIRLCVLSLAFASNASFACKVAPPSAQALIDQPQIAVVEGRFRPAQGKAAENAATFVVERVLRGRIDRGEFTVAEGGAFGSLCEYQEIDAGYPQPVEGIPPRLPKNARQYLFVARYDKEEKRLIVPMSWSYGINHLGERVLIPTNPGCETSTKRFEAAVHGAALKNGRKAKAAAPLCPASTSPSYR